MKKRVLSGIRATGNLHLGNYLGAVKGMLELQDNQEYETLYMVADYHTITTPYNVEELREVRMRVITDYLAAGLDPQKSIIFFQSDLPEHFELMYFFSSVSTIARMQHLPTYKEKVTQHPQHNTMALLNYPLLMAADILIYKASSVPVGIDQEPHLEVAREIARKMNEKYKTDFPEPTRFKTKGEYIPSLKGEGKMGKSIEGSYINLTDNEDIIRKKIAKVPTDSGEKTSEVPENTLYKLFKAIAPEKLDDDYVKPYTEGKGYSVIKENLSKIISDLLKPLQDRRAGISNEDVLRVTKDGAERARAIAKQTLREVREKMGLA